MTNPSTLHVRRWSGCSEGDRWSGITVTIRSCTKQYIRPIGPGRAVSCDRLEQGIAKSASRQHQGAQLHLICSWSPSRMSSRLAPLALCRKLALAAQSPSRWRMKSNGLDQESSARVVSGRREIHSRDLKSLIYKNGSDKAAESKQNKNEKKEDNKPKKKARRAFIIQIGIAEQLEFSQNGHLFVPNLLSVSGTVGPNHLFNSVIRSDRLTIYCKSFVMTTGLKSLSGSCSTLIEYVELHGELRDVRFTQDEKPYASLLRKICLDKGIGKLAADLLGVDSVMLYQATLTLPWPGSGGRIAVTPINDLDDSPLEFASVAGSHRDFALPYWFSNEGMMNLEDRNYPIKSHAPLAPGLSPVLAQPLRDHDFTGDATVHHGWLLHSAPPNLSEDTRIAFTISYAKTGKARASFSTSLKKSQGPDDCPRKGSGGHLTTKTWRFEVDLLA
eukprot:765915-Hanusia_phi.AAC.1